MDKKARALIWLLALLALLLAACSAGAGAPTATAGPADLSSARGAYGIAPGGVAMAEPAPASIERTDASAPKAGEPAIPVAQAFDPERALILTASVALRSKEPWTVSDRVQTIALGLGGDVMSLQQSGSGEQRTAMLTVRVPQARFNDAIRQIRDIADVEVLSSNVEGKDVTDQFVDLQARLTAKQTEEQRYVALLARANTIDEILKIDQSLAVVRTQIEQLTAQLNSIKARTTYSTITVQVSPIAPQPKPTLDPSAYDPSRTAERAFAALASLMRSVLDAAIWTLVFGWIPLVVFGLVLLVTRSRARIIPAA